MKNPSHTKVYCKYGAPMGRGYSQLTARKVHLARVNLDSGGYDRGGAYWGHGEPIFVAWDDDGGELYVRAQSREAAKVKIAAEHHEEGLRFYR